PRRSSNLRFSKRLSAKVMLYLIHCTSTTVLHTVYDVKHCFYKIPSHSSSEGAGESEISHFHSWRFSNLARLGEKGRSLPRAAHFGLRGIGEKTYVEWGSVRVRR